MTAKARITFNATGRFFPEPVEASISFQITAPCLPHIPIEAAKEILTRIAIAITNPDGFEELARSISSESCKTRLAAVPTRRKKARP
jgi:hypothetical protein